MGRSNWFARHRIFYISIAAATLYFALEPFFRQFYFEFSPGSFIVLHSIMEAISIIVAFMCFGVTFHSQKMAKNGQNLFLGVAFLTVGLLDVFHALSYHGMPDFITANTVNKATQLWIIARLVGAAAFLAAAFIRPDRSTRFIRPLPLLGAGLVIPAVVLYVIVTRPGALPAMFVEGAGLTPLKVGLEYLIVAMEAAAAIAFFRLYRKTHEDHLVYFIGAMALGIFSELFFSLYASPYDIFNLMGHVYKVGSYLFIYQMLFVTSVAAPYTALSNAKEVLSEYSEHLEDTVMERTRELTAQNKELLRLGRLKDEFLAVCSHDMKGPLHSSILLIELLLDGVEGELTPDQRDSLGTVMENEYAQLNLVTNLLELARKEEGLKLDLADVDVKGMLESWAARQRLVAGKKEISFRVDVPGGITWRLDEFKITQVLNNLFSNAVKFAPPGGEIRLSAATDGLGGLLRISMFNTGPAIPVSELETVFDRFTQSENGKKAAQRGMGLGLNIAKRNVELHGGRIWAEAEAGVGNIFVFTLPNAQKNSLPDGPR